VCGVCVCLCGVCVVCVCGVCVFVCVCVCVVCVCVCVVFVCQHSLVHCLLTLPEHCTDVLLSLLLRSRHRGTSSWRG